MKEHSNARQVFCVATLLLAIVATACGKKSESAGGPEVEPASSAPKAKVPPKNGEHLMGKVTYSFADGRVVTARHAEGFEFDVVYKNEPTPSLDEGKMGRRGSSRTSGSYAMKRDETAALSKQQAIEAAKKGGVLGVLKKDVVRCVPPNQVRYTATALWCENQEGKKNGPSREWNDRGTMLASGNHVDGHRDGIWELRSGNGAAKCVESYRKKKLRTTCNKKSRPAISIGEIELLDGNASTEALRVPAQGALKDLTACHEKGLEVIDNLHGKVAIDTTISAKGVVKKTEIFWPDSNNKFMAEKTVRTHQGAAYCFTQALSRQTFPAGEASVARFVIDYDIEVPAQ